jgi:hypothetical protein
MCIPIPTGDYYPRNLISFKELRGENEDIYLIYLFSKMITDYLL